MVRPSSIMVIGVMGWEVYVVHGKDVVVLEGYVRSYVRREHRAYIVYERGDRYMAVLRHWYEWSLVNH